MLRAWEAKEQMALVCPVKTKIPVLVRMSQMRTEPSRPPAGERIEWPSSFYLCFGVRGRREHGKWEREGREIIECVYYLYVYRYPRSIDSILSVHCMSFLMQFSANCLVNQN